ncbi:hypothetical protein Pcinc_014951 [Petrolisthes cinctipes]|uniref:Uncharacterized protein n=1 Tax=Petrolisthes cinctipes TaxID=88211 RepID=A0AAE1KSP8_PETCI|nr:hypothetical protein Pcinc_014951 [Petrolisthes cinctipes]
MAQRRKQRQTWQSKVFSLWDPCPCCFFVHGKLRGRGGISASFLSNFSAIGALPQVPLVVNGVSCRALVDKGCTKRLVHVSLCSSWTRQNLCVTTMSGERYVCDGTGTLSVQLKSGVSSQVEVLVLSARPLNFDFILGMNAVLIFKGVTVRTPNDVKFGVDEVVQCGMVERPLNPVSDKSVLYGMVTSQSNVVIDEKDFLVNYEAKSRKWTVSWKWGNKTENPCLENTMSEYHIRPNIREKYDSEFLQWI